MNLSDSQKQNPIVVLFVGCLPKEFKGIRFLGGAAPCHWYLNPTIKEAAAYYERIISEKITVWLPPISDQPIVLPELPKREHRDLKDLLESDLYSLSKEGCECTVTISGIPQDRVWWYKACNTCSNKSSIQSSALACAACGSTDIILRYKLTFMASDETVEARMFCFDSIAKRIVGKSCPSVVSSVTKTWLIPLELASIVSLKFTFAVVYNDVPFHDVDKELLIKSIILAHGRVRSLPTPQTFTPALLPATPEKSISPGNLIDSP